MSKEVKRWDLRIVNRYAGDGTGEIETDATMKAGPHGRYVLHSDYQALLAERDARAKDAERESAAFNAVITYILGKGSMESPMEFLRCWNEGDFESLREEWPEAPQEIYYADPFADYDVIDAALQGAKP